MKVEWNTEWDKKWAYVRDWRPAYASTNLSKIERRYPWERQPKTKFGRGARRKRKARNGNSRKRNRDAQKRWG